MVRGLEGLIDSQGMAMLCESVLRYGFENNGMNI